MKNNNYISVIYPSFRLSVAPMMDWTDRHCRYFHRQLSRRALLYTEMVTTGAVIHGDRAHLLGFSPQEHPVALQLGSSDPAQLEEATRIGADFGYDEINLNVGCPSDRVQSGRFGACLMREPDLVARCAEAMQRGAGNNGPLITIKSRIGVDDQTPATALRHFIQTVSAAGISHFIIHARKAWLEGLSPKDNRTIPPLDYPLVAEIREEYPSLTVILNGGIETAEQATRQLGQGFEGVMIGRAAYHDSWDILGNADRDIFGEAANPLTAPEEVIPPMVDYIRRGGFRTRKVARHMLGLFNGRPGAKAWRRSLSEQMHDEDAPPEILFDAVEAMRARQPEDITAAHQA